MKVIEFQNDVVLKNNFWEATSRSQFYNCISISKLPGPFTQKLIVAFASTYVFYYTFSIETHRKNIHSSRLSDEHLHAIFESQRQVCKLISKN